MSGVGRRTRRTIVTALTLGLVASAPLGPPASAAEPMSSANEDAVISLQADPTLVEIWERLGSVVEKTGALGVYMDDDGTLVVVVPESGTSSFTPASADFVPMKVRTETASVEFGELAEVRGEVQRKGWRPTRDGVFFPDAEFDARRGVIEVISDAPEQVFSDVLADHQGAVVYRREAMQMTSGSRADDDSPHYAGAGMDWAPYSNSTEPDCTAGFAVRNSAGEDRMVTAAHCVIQGGTGNVKSPLGTSFGSVVSMAGFDNGDGVDAALIDGPGISHAARIYRGWRQTTVSIPIAEGATSTGFDTWHCIGGALDGDKCGLFDLDIAEYTKTFTWGGADYTLRYLQKWVGRVNGLTSCPGDSGGPFYTIIQDAGEPQPDRARINGTITGGSPPETCVSGRNVYVTKISRIFKFYPNWTIKTSS